MLLCFVFAERSREAQMRINKILIRTELLPILAIVVLMTFARSSLADHYFVPSGSMEYSLLPGDRVVVDKTAYGLRIPLTKIDIIGDSTPARGDVAVFDSPLDGRRLIKRIVAIGGDRVSLTGGRLTINGRPLGSGEAELFGERLALLNLDVGGGPNIPEQTVPDGMVLALGDHRGDSLDGRYFGFIDEKELLGRALGIYYRRDGGFGWHPL